MPSSSVISLDQVLEPRAAYDLAAEYYDSWDWQTFWRVNELPVAMAMLEGKPDISRILDVGSGTGLYLQNLRERGSSVTGLDISENMLRRARQRLGRHASLVMGDAQALPFGERVFDLLVCMRVLSQVSKAEDAFGEFGRILRTGGWLLISDLDIEHNYRETRLPIGDTFVRTKTYKRSMQELFELAQRVGSLDLIASHRFNAHNIAVAKSPDKFRTIDESGNRAIGFVALLRQS